MLLHVQLRVPEGDPATGKVAAPAEVEVGGNPGERLVEAAQLGQPGAVDQRALDGYGERVKAIVILLLVRLARARTKAQATRAGALDTEPLEPTRLGRKEFGSSHEDPASAAEGQ